MPDLANKKQSIHSAITDALEHYYVDLRGEKPANVYEMCVDAVEKPLLEFIMARTRDNQSQASLILGINRNTLRKKLIRHGLIGSKK